LRRRAIVSLRAFRRLAACALPRPSATASAKLAKITVNQSQIASCVTKLPRPGSAVKIPMVVRAAPTIVTNMTGLFTISRGFNFLNASPIAGPTMFQSKSDAGFCVMSISEEFSSLHEEMLDDWAKSQRREKIECADQKHGSKKQNKKRATGDWKSADAWRRDFLLHQRARQCHDRHDHKESAEQHVETKRCVIGRCISRETCECAPVVTSTGAKRVKDLA